MLCCIFYVSDIFELSLLIYPGKVSNAQCFRIGHIGRLTVENMQTLVDAVSEIVVEMGVKFSN